MSAMPVSAALPTPQIDGLFFLYSRTGASAEKEATIGFDAFPSPDDLWARYRAWKGLTPEAEAVVFQD